MKIRQVQMVMSAMSTAQYPKDGLPQIAFAGRSNVGKSSAINALLQRRSIARVSQQPGKTRTINFYRINEEFYFVDLPGYGYAKISQQERARWSDVMEDYFHVAEPLTHLFLLLDIRHAPRPEDIMMHDFAHRQGIPVTIIATKADKISRGAWQKSFKGMRETLQYHGEKIYPVSALKKTGFEELWLHMQAQLETAGYPIRTD